MTCRDVFLQKNPAKHAFLLLKKAEQLKRRCLHRRRLNDQLLTVYSVSECLLEEFTSLVCSVIQAVEIFF